MGDWSPQYGWEINDGPEHVHQHGMKTAFMFSEKAAGNFSYLATEFNAGEMDPAWTGSWFLERGQTDVEWGPRILPPWSTDQEYIYDKSITAFLRKTNADTRRIEGEIMVGGKKEAIIVFFAKDACYDQNNVLTNMLIIIVRATFPWTGATATSLSQDGTGHARER